MLADVWDGLPDRVRTSLLAIGERDWRRVFDGVANVNPTWRPIRAPLMTAAGYRAVHALSDRIAELILAACRRRAGTAGELRAALGVPPGAIRLLDEHEPLTEHLLQSMRPDIVLSGGIPRFVECNSDSSLGGVFDSDTVAARYLELYRGSGLGIEAPPPGVDVRFGVIRDGLRLAEGARLAMVFSLDGSYPGMEQPRKFIEALDPVCARGRAAGLDTVAYPVQWLETDSRNRLIADGRPVDAVFRLVVPNKVDDCGGLAALTGAVAAGTVRMFTTSAAFLLGNKRIFAWLWEDLDLLAAGDRRLVRDHVPHTVSLTAETLERSAEDRDRLVLKPIDGYGGEGVVIGRELTAAAWRAALDRAAAGGHVVQEFVEPDRIAMHFAHLGTGATAFAEVPYSIGPYRFGRRPAGGEFRLGSPGGGLVLNVSRGAHVTGFLLI